MWKTAPVAVVLGLCMAAVGSARGDDSLQWSGFGTVGAYQARGDGVRLRPDVASARSAADGEVRFDGDSRLGLQLQWQAHPDWELVAQAVMTDDLEHRWRPRTTWLYAQGQLGASWRVRLGRQTLPTLRHSETRAVGYAQASVRPPTAVYSLNPGTPVDGANLSGEADWAGGTVRMDVGIGTATVQRPGFRLDLRQSRVAVLEWQRDAVLLRASASHFRFNLNRNPLESLGAACSNCAALAAGPARNQGIDGSLYGVLAVWSPGRWEWSLEALERPRANSSLTPAARALVVMGTVRWDAWKWHAAVGRLRFREPSLGLLPSASASAEQAAIVAALDRSLVSPFDLNTVQVGLRWDVQPRLALKVQHERWRATRDRTTGRNLTVIVTTPPLGSDPPTWNGRAALSTVSLDFVF